MVPYLHLKRPLIYQYVKFYLILFSWPQGVLDLQDSFLEGDRKVSALFGHFIAAVGDLNIDGYQGNCGNIQTHRSEGNPGFF